MYRSCRSISPGPEVGVAIQDPRQVRPFRAPWSILNWRQWPLLRNRRVVDYPFDKYRSDRISANLVPPPTSSISFFSLFPPFLPSFLPSFLLSSNSRKFKFYYIRKLFQTYWYMWLCDCIIIIGINISLNLRGWISRYEMYSNFSDFFFIISLHEKNEYCTMIAESC